MKTRVPKYAVQPIRDFVAYLEDCDRLLHVSIRGIAGLRGIPNAVDVLQKLDPESIADAKISLS